MKLTRRQLLKWVGGGMAAWALSPARPLAATSEALSHAHPYYRDYEDFFAPPTPLGRIATWWGQVVRKGPSPKAGRVRTYTRDEVIPLLAAVKGVPPWPSNDVWYQTSGGFIHSGYVQPVRDDPQPPVTEVREPGFWGQVAVPIARARPSPDSEYVSYKLYYGTLYRVVALAEDEAGNPWYQLKDGVTWTPGPYVPAETLRYVAREEVSPLSPGHPDKTILIDVNEQTLTCLEGETPVFHTRIASGNHSTATPRGEFRVLRKGYTSRMIGGEGADHYDLPGVPYCTYFTWSGVAIHGTYWHNDYGQRHSHGCVNVSSDDARWVFRWAEPATPYEMARQLVKPPEAGTRVVVI